MASDLRNYYENDISLKAERKKQEKEDDKRYANSELELRAQQEARNSEFLQKLKNGWRRNDEIVTLYDKLYRDAEEKRKAMDQQTIERPFLEKLRKDVEKEENELKLRNEMNRDCNEFLLKQIEQNKIKKQLLKLEEAILDNEKLQKDLDTNNLQDKKFKENYRQKLAENLKVLKSQIEKSKTALLNNEMNQVEADMNNHTTVRVDYIRPNDDLIGGIPGLGISHERKMQLDTIDKNLLMNDKALNNPKN